MGNNLPRVDISILLFKTRPYLNDLIPSLFKIDYPKDKLAIYVINNESPDDSYEEFQRRCRGKNYFRFLNSGYNLGFAEGHNVTMRVGSGKYIFLLNPDGEILPDTIAKMVKQMEARLNVGLADGIQMPIVHHKGYDPKTFETSWCSGACMMIRRKALQDTGLFDSNFFMYSEDVDLSWRMWSKSWKCITIPDAKVIHYLEGDKKQKHKFGQISLNAYYRSLRNGLFIRYIYGEKSDYMRFFFTVARLISIPGYFFTTLRLLFSLPLYPFRKLLSKILTRIKTVFPYNKTFPYTILKKLIVTSSDRRFMVLRAIAEQVILLPHLRVRRKLQILNKPNNYVAQWEKL